MNRQMCPKCDVAVAWHLEKCPTCKTKKNEFIFTNSPSPEEIEESDARSVASYPKGNSTFGKKSETIEQQNVIGNAAAQRTVKYASLFESIGYVLQILCAVSACLLLFVGFFISGPVWVKLVYWVAIVIFWAFSYAQTSLIRGLASYFQMKASDHIIRHWQK
jgi:hypothetical protein